MHIGETHRVENVASELGDINAFRSDIALCEAVDREGGTAQIRELDDFGALTGQASYRELGALANKFLPELDTHDRFGNRIDQIRYHDAYHQLMRSALQNGLHSSPWNMPGKGAHVVRAAKNLLQSQVEAGHGCPITMTFASIPCLRAQRNVADMFVGRVLANDYDPRNRPFTEKTAITVGMGMTEKQGGSDVRANTTAATPVAAAGPGELYSLTGHKWFLSAPMCDVFLVLAQTAGGLSCFALPRWTPDGGKNALNVIRLKDKMGNRSNASSEVEFRGALAWMIGEEGRGVPTIIEMVNLTRFDCMTGSTALMRTGLVHAIHHCKQRAAFGAKLWNQALMRNVLADLALEYEASVALTMRMAAALDRREDNEHEDNLLRLVTALGKYWVCKRAPGHSYEIMECIGGSGVMENSIYPRLFRESVINPIWEGSGNIQCLDVLRAIRKKPAVLKSLLVELELARGQNQDFDSHLGDLSGHLSALSQKSDTELQLGARQLVELMATAMQAALLLRNAPSSVGTAFCSSRLAARGAHNYGCLAISEVACDELLHRASPN